MLTFKPWKPFRASKSRDIVRGWLREVATKSEEVFKAGMTGSHSGNLDIRANGSVFFRSAPDEYPAVDSGKLIASMKTNVDDNSATIGTNTPYSKRLRLGQGRFRRRKMSDNALNEGTKLASRKIIGWAGWKRNP